MFYRGKIESILYHCLERLRIGSQGHTADSENSFLVSLFPQSHLHHSLHPQSHHLFRCPYTSIITHPFYLSAIWQDVSKH